jgi:hypothetical protein
MRALIAVAESFVGVNLSNDKLIALISDLTTNDFPVDITSKFSAAGKTCDAYYVKDNVAVIKKALSVLDPMNEYNIVIVRPGDANYNQVKELANGSVLRVAPGHWQEGDKTGVFKWDSYFGSSNEKEIKENRYIVITKQN